MHVGFDIEVFNLETVIKQQNLPTNKYQEWVNSEYTPAFAGSLLSV